MRNFARAAATAALAVAAVVTPLAGTAMAAPTQSSWSRHHDNDGGDWCSNFGQHHWTGNWGHRSSRWNNHCGRHWDRRIGDRGSWHSRHWFNDPRAESLWDCDDRF